MRRRPGPRWYAAVLRRAGDDRGQALPVYVTAIGALLVLAFAYVAVGRAAVVAGGARTAADAAALGAASATRDQLRDAVARIVTGGHGDLGAVLDGRWPGLPDPCEAAGAFAGRNGAHLTACQVDGARYTVSVETDADVGHTLVPGTEGHRGHAGATAELTPRCGLSATSPGTPGTPGTLHCDGGDFPLDPAHPGTLPSAADLFAVRLIR
ncbi:MULTISPECIES: hypothetical protein [Streptomycetaceae]|uniref:hypothetical protein n=1 Tax=Streptomycetaceae TaxID=2062 RepID=UPI000213FEF2|nr:hypothetical protein [Streptantibioticus cattleyicolor]MYS60763.1 hypothetical protein [Streptomyces sp. SID5468]CCB76582.1 putative secreted protein [Streptantibioticus cattleyicolor NRRL 8057 = DSM 46488]